MASDERWEAGGRLRQREIAGAALPSKEPGFLIGVRREKRRNAVLAAYGVGDCLARCLRRFRVCLCQDHGPAVYGWARNCGLGGHEPGEQRGVRPKESDRELDQLLYDGRCLRLLRKTSIWGGPRNGEQPSTFLFLPSLPLAAIPSAYHG